MGGTRDSFRHIWFLAVCFREPALPFPHVADRIPRVVLKRRRPHLTVGARAPHLASAPTVGLQLRSIPIS